MNVDNLRDNYSKLISYMEESGYSKIYTSRIASEIKRILKLANTKKWLCYTDVYMEYEKTSRSKDYLRNKQNIIGAIEQFDVYGKYPDGKNRHKLFLRGAYPMLLPEFKAIIDYYCKAEKERGKKDSTIHSESHNASTFLLFQQQQGADSLNKITEKSVLAFFLSSEGKLYRGCTYKKNIAAVFKACIPYSTDVCKNIIAFLPALRERRKNIQYLTREEIGKIKVVLADNSSVLTLRDKAIGILALYTGLRGCDIAGMKISSIDWNADVICIKQQKTESLLKLPLTAIVGNALYDYLTLERPQIESNYLFISQNKPYRHIESRSIGNVSIKIMTAAGIRQSKDDRKGFHIFRHHLATALLGNGVPQPVISKTLGHNSPDSLETYLSADFLHLKECAISVEKFPISEGVFTDE